MRIAEGGLRCRGNQRRTSDDMPLITVITVVYNGEAHLEQTIQSVLGQHYGNVEYLLIDGGSTDRTMDIILKYQDQIDYWVSGPDKGIYDAMNKGIDLAKGELIGLINSDDYYEPGAIELVVNRYKENRHPQIIYGNTYIIHQRFKLRYKSFAHTKYWLGMGILHPAMFVHRDVYKAIGKYDLEYELAADYDFFVRALLNGVSMIQIDGFLVNYRSGGSSEQRFPTTLDEYREIICRHTGVISVASMIYRCHYIKSRALIVVQEIIGILFGEDVLIKCKEWYLKKFFAKERTGLT